MAFSYAQLLDALETDHQRFFTDRHFITTPYAKNMIFCIQANKSLTIARSFRTYRWALAMIRLGLHGYCKVFKEGALPALTITRLRPQDDTVSISWQIGCVKDDARVTKSHSAAFRHFFLQSSYYRPFRQAEVLFQGRSVFDVFRISDHDYIVTRHCIDMVVPPFKWSPLMERLFQVTNHSPILTSNKTPI